MYGRGKNVLLADVVVHQGLNFTKWELVKMDLHLHLHLFMKMDIHEDGIFRDFAVKTKAKAWLDQW